MAYIAAIHKPGGGNGGIHDPFEGVGDRPNSGMSEIHSLGSASARGSSKLKKGSRKVKQPFTEADAKGVDGTQRLVETLAALEKSLGKLRTETAKLRAETNDGLSGIGKKVERLESITGELPAYKSMSSGSGREMYGGSGGGGAGFGMAQMMRRSNTEGSGNSSGAMLGAGAMSFNSAMDDPPSFEKYEPPPQRHPQNREGVVIKGGRNTKKCRVLWTQSDRFMCWGTIPILTEGSLKYGMEVTTLLLVLVSVILIIVQSYPEHDPFCTPVVTAVTIPGVVDDSAVSDSGGSSAAAAAAAAAVGNTTSYLTTYVCDTSTKNYEVKGYWEIFYLQMFLVIWFTLEYILRFVAVRPAWNIRRPYTRHQFWSAKLMHVLNPMTIVDLLSITPFYVERMVEASGGDLKGAGTILTVLRVIRIMRVFKLTRHNQTLTDFMAAMKIIANDILVISVVLATIMVLVATAIFYAEKGANHPKNFENDIWFDTIPDCLYWTVITFTSVGYGDIVPVTKIGRGVAGASALMSVLLVNFPMAIIIMSFDEVYKIRKGREERAALVVERLFKWSDRHRKKHAVINNNKVGPGGEALGAGGGGVGGSGGGGAGGGGDNGKRGGGKKEKRPSLGKIFSGTSNFSQAQIRRQKQRDIAKNKKNRRVAKGKLLDLILHPHHIHKSVGNGVFNGRDHFLASKYSTKWVKVTEAGRAKREDDALSAIERKKTAAGIIVVQPRDQFKKPNKSKSLAAASQAAQSVKPNRSQSFAKIEAEDYSVI